VKWKDPQFSDEDEHKGTLVEFRATGGQTVVPPSVHPSGEAYEWDRTGEPATEDPDVLRRACARLATAALLARRWPTSGTRHDFALALAGFLLRAGCDDLLAALLVESAARAARDPEWGDRQRAVRDTAAKLAAGGPVTGAPSLGDFIADADRVTAKVRDWLGLRAAGPAPDAEHCSDLGNARRLVRLHGADLRYSTTHGWLAWDGRRWARDETGEPVRRAKATARTLYDEAARATDEAARKALAAHAVRSEGERRLAAMVTLAESEPGVPLTVDQLDADPWLLTVANGTLDLRAGTLRAHRREDLATRLCPVAYDPAAACPTWAAFLARVLPDEATRLYVQKLIGYALTGDVREQVFPIFSGAGSNGKSTLLETVAGLLGDYARATRAETFLTKRGDAIPNDLAALRGIRFAYAVEPDAGRRLAESLVKSLTGGDTLSARFMYREYFTFRPSFKLVLATNHRPRIVGGDHAIWRRIRLIPFDVTIPDVEQDKALPEKLRAEWPGILAWAVEGCLLWQCHGLDAPTTVTGATADYREEQDAVRAFLADRCLRDPASTIAAGVLYEAYVSWCHAEHEEAVSKRMLGVLLRERGVEPYRTEAERGWRGITLAPREPRA
jgi:putative DNA primase/helicase